YTEDRDLEDDTRVILANNVMKVLSPIAPSEDFMFLMYESKNADFNPFFILLHLTKSPEFVSEGKYHYDYVCSGPKERFSQTLSSFSSVLNSSQQYFTPIKLFEETALSGASGSVRPEINGVVLLLLWKGEPFCNLINKSDLCDNPEQWDVFNPTVWNCKPLVLNELGIYIIE
ncbi:MAG: hypothetical protein JW703_05530, partial [Candidatus Diapherotrites archaeon]|nr:hypothetical protein [Candidatus Diapherotrites archaeon]